MIKFCISAILISHQRRFRLDIRKDVFIKMVSSIRAGCLGRRFSHHASRYLLGVYLWHSGTWLTDELGKVRLAVRVHDLEDLFQSKLFYDSSHSCLMPPSTCKVCEIYITIRAYIGILSYIQIFGL